MHGLCTSTVDSDSSNAVLKYDGFAVTPPFSFFRWPSVLLKMPVLAAFRSSTFIGNISG